MIESLLVALIVAICVQLVIERAQPISIFLIRQLCKLLPEDLRAIRQEQLEADAIYTEGNAWKILNALWAAKFVVPEAIQARARKWPKGSSLDEFVTNVAAELLPEKKRERYREEWHGHRSQLAGKFTRLSFCIGILIAAWRISRMMRSEGE